MKIKAIVHLAEEVETLKALMRIAGLTEDDL